MSSRSSATISIGDLAALTGVATSTLRSWEERLGFPQPVRTTGGQRRYRTEDARLVTSVVAARARGLSLAAAVDAVRHVPRVGADSLFAQLRARHPHLDVLSVGFATMRSLSWAIEDECLAHASHPVLFGSFQVHQAFERAAHRWRELSRSASAAVVFADFPETVPKSRPARVAVSPDSPMLNEWTLVCHDPEMAVALVAWEQPRAHDDAPRRFEGLLTLEPDVVRDAASIYARTAEESGLAGIVDLVELHTRHAGEDPRRTASLLRRYASYADS